VPVPPICICGNCGICEQFRFVNNDQVIGKPAARASHGNVNEDNFDDCFRYWEIRSLGVGVKEILKKKSPNLPNSKTPSSESK